MANLDPNHLDWLQATPEELAQEQEANQINYYRQILDGLLDSERGIIKLVLESGALQQIEGQNDFFIIPEGKAPGEVSTQFLTRTKNYPTFKRLLSTYLGIKVLSPDQVEFADELLGKPVQNDQEEGEIAFFLDKKSILLLIKALGLNEGLCISQEVFEPISKEA